MHLPRPRLRLWTLPIAVAVAGIGLGSQQMWQRHAYYQRQAAHYASQERRCLAAAEIVLAEGLLGCEFYSPEERPTTARSLRAEAAEHGRTRAIYQRAARFPWLRVPPGTPHDEPIEFPPPAEDAFAIPGTGEDVRDGLSAGEAE
jgi:hypothetical protein